MYGSRRWMGKAKRAHRGRSLGTAGEGRAFAYPTSAARSPAAAADAMAKFIR